MEDISETAIKRIIGGDKKHCHVCGSKLHKGDKEYCKFCQAKGW